ncbi:hypothetical protein K438DRAFT_1944227 [Mycena galopus ATCC 62051]|nr:hypothetical protein K438DRAFT_1944227 [Mycena galopus ATCC 62051]
MKREGKSEHSRPSVYAPSHSSDVHPASDGQGRGKARSIQRERMRTGQLKCHFSALSQEDQNPSEIADIRELRMKLCNTRSMLHQTRRARAQTPNGTPAQRVEHIKEGWGDVRASKSKRGNATHDLRVRPSYWRALAGLSSGAAEKGPMRLVCVAVAGGDDGGREGAGLREERRPKRRGTERGEVGMGGRRIGACGAQLRRSRVKAQARDGEARKDGRRGPELRREARSERWKGKAARRKKSEVARAKDPMEERRRTSENGEESKKKTQNTHLVKIHIHPRTPSYGCECAKEEVELVEMEKRAAYWATQRVVGADRAHPFSPGYARSLSIKGMPSCKSDTDARLLLGLVPMRLLLIAADLLNRVAACAMLSFLIAACGGGGRSSVFGRHHDESRKWIKVESNRQQTRAGHEINGEVFLGTLHHDTLIETSTEDRTALSRV